MNDIQYYIMQGLYYGYSKEAIHAYIIRRHDVDNLSISTFTPSSSGTVFEGTGFIPSERELKMSLEAVTSDVNSRRMCTTPFPHSGPEDGFEKFIETMPDIRHEILDVLFYLKENTYESYLRVNAERRSRGDVPVR